MRESEQLPEAIRQLDDILVDLALTRASLDQIVDRVGLGLQEAGVPVGEIRATARTLHPTIDALRVTWRGSDDRDADFWHHSVAARESWRQSPMFFMIETGTRRLHRPLHAADCPRDFPVLEDFAAAGVTDYLCHLFVFGDLDGSRGEGAIFRWLCRAPGGFDSKHLQAIDHIAPRMAAALEPGNERLIARNLLDTYVGRRSGAAVLEGRIQPGQTEAIEAVILVADLAGFTAASDALPGETLTNFLDRHLEAMVPPVHHEGGEILAFLGDGFLAAFDVAGDPKSACRCGVQAARSILGSVATLRDEDPSLLRVDVALHMGTVRYGNVGADGRQAFTVIGPAVNLASRIEALCGSLGHQCLISADVAQHLPRESVCSLGPHSVKGVESQIDIFALK